MNAPAKIDKPVEFTLPIKDYNEFYRFYLTEHRSIAYNTPGKLDQKIVVKKIE